MFKGCELDYLALPSRLFLFWSGQGGLRDVPQWSSLHLIPLGSSEC
jgi:hypothetical protein